MTHDSCSCVVGRFFLILQLLVNTPFVNKFAALNENKVTLGLLNFGGSFFHKKKL
jgi:hypothetical protein